MWIKIEHLKEYIKGREMFVVRAFDVEFHNYTRRYTTDPYCTWLEEDHLLREDEFYYPRWPHPFPPTHFCLLPIERE